MSFRLQGARKQLTLTENAQLWLIPTICYGKKQTAIAFEGAWRHCISRQHLQNLEWKEIIPLPLHLAFNISTSVNKGIHPWPHQTRRSASSHVGSHVFSCCVLGTSQQFFFSTTWSKTRRKQLGPYNTILLWHSMTSKTVAKGKPSSLVKEEHYLRGLAQKAFVPQK